MYTKNYFWIFRSPANIKQKLDYYWKFIVLGLALWMIGDQVFDGLQSHTYKIYSLFWNDEWHADELRPCNETQLKECWDKIQNTADVAGNIIETDCGEWDKTTKTITLNCKLLLHWAYFACSLACWFLPPLVFGSCLTYMRYKVRTQNWSQWSSEWSEISHCWNWHQNDLQTMRPRCPT